jgi:cytochrome c peroxidase
MRQTLKERLNPSGEFRNQISGNQQAQTMPRSSVDSGHCHSFSNIPPPVAVRIEPHAVTFTRKGPYDPILFRILTAFATLLTLKKDAISIDALTAAIAAYERTLVAGDSLFYRYLYGGEVKAMTPAAQRGLTLFRGRAQCDNCHLIGKKSALFTDGDFHSSPLPLAAETLGALALLTEKVRNLKIAGAAEKLSALIASDKNASALGRFVVTGDPKDIGKFKTPSLRNVALTAPYMHDGSVGTLAQAIDLELYSRTVPGYPLVLTQDERADLLAFLQALSSPPRTGKRGRCSRTP